MNSTATNLNSADEPSVSGTTSNFGQFVDPIMAPALTAQELVGIAHVLIDAEVSASLEPDADRTFHAGALKGITVMCAAATSALSACGPASAAQQAGAAPADQHGDAQSNQAVTPQSDGREQHPGATQQASLIFSNRPHSSKIVGEHCAGKIVDITTGVAYEVMVMPGELTCVTWDEAKRTILAVGGDLPTPVEMSMLAKLLGRIAFQESYWVNEKVKFDGDAEESISYFSDGVFDFSDARDRMHARGVRRICIGNAADENLDEVDDNTVVVPAPTVPANAVTHVRPGLAPAQEIPECVENVAPDSGLTFGKMGKLVGAQRRACDLLEATGMPALVEAAGALHSATGDLWDAVQEQVAINALPPTLDSWMMTPAGLARVLVGALRKQNIKELGEYNDAVEDCIAALVGTLSAGAGADQGDASISASGPDLSGRADLQQLRDSMLTDLMAPTPLVPIEDVVDTLAQLRRIADEAIDDEVMAAFRSANRIIMGLLPHAGAGVEA